MKKERKKSRWEMKSKKWKKGVEQDKTRKAPAVACSWITAVMRKKNPQKSTHRPKDVPTDTT